jgi:hypothetical protein
MKITINLIGEGGPLEHTTFDYTREVGPLNTLQKDLKEVINGWCLLPGDRITIEADEELWR